MNNYNVSFEKRFSNFLYAQQKYPFVMKDEYSIALKICDLQDNNIFLNIPADFNSLEPLLKSNIQYFPLEINKEFSLKTNYKFCSELHSLPFKNQSVDIILSLTSLHHFNNDERFKFYNECLRLTNKLIIGDVISNSQQDKWLNVFVNKYNSSGHIGNFFSEKDKDLIESCGFIVDVKKVKYKWFFENETIMIDFCKNLFGLDLANHDTIKNGIKEYFTLNNDFSIDWELIYFICKNPFRLQNKPENWNKLALYKKIQIYKMNLNYSYSKYVDKLVVKEILKNKNIKHLHCAKLIKELKSIHDITQSDIDNNNHILKSTHASGWNINLNGQSIEYIKNKLSEWNVIFTGLNEPHYKYIKPRFFIEEKINDKYLGKNGEALVYMFRCIHGEPISLGIKHKKLQNSYDIDFNLMHKELDFIIRKPENYSNILNIVRELSKIFEFVRIDLYLSKDNKIYFSEFTFTPNGGSKFFNNKLEIEYGMLWK
jgi:hypothetical protein